MGLMVCHMSHRNLLDSFKAAIVAAEACIFAHGASPLADALFHA